MEVLVEMDVVVKFVCTAWAIWYNWNVARNGGQRQNGRKLVSWVAHYMEEYNEANKGKDCTKMSVEAQDNWSPPLANVFNVNVDAAVFARQKAVGVGVIVRDEKGRLEAALCKKIQAPLGAMEAEAMAHEAGLVFAKDIGIHNIILEGDSLIIHNALCETSNPPSSVAAVIQGMQDLCRDFREVEFSHVRRQCNTSAHLLAKYALGVSDFITWNVLWVLVILSLGMRRILASLSKLLPMM